MPRRILPGHSEAGFLNHFRRKHFSSATSPLRWSSSCLRRDLKPTCYLPFFGLVVPRELLQQ